MKIILVLFLCIGCSAFGQDKVEKKLEKELGQELVRIASDDSRAPGLSEIDTIWSRTKDSVIIGFAFEGEYISQSNIAEHQAIVNARYLGEYAVSKKEFLEFRQWVLDSTARFICYFGLEGYYDGIEWLKVPAGLRGRRYHSGAPDFSDREAMAHLFPLNWDRKFYYDDPELVPIFSDLYISHSERLRRQKIIDYRKLFYQYGKPVKENLEKVPILMDSYNWVRPSDGDFGRTTVLSMLDEKLYLEAPVTHIEPFMAAAYCHWKTKQCNKELHRKDYRVKIRIPTAEELSALAQEKRPSIKMDAFNPTENWRITNMEYREFSQYALDSLSKEYLYSITEDGEIALQLIDYYSYYYSESDLEYVEIDPNDRIGTRQHFNLNEDPVDWEEFGYQDQLEVIKEIDLDSVPFRYEWMDAKNRGLEPEKLRITGKLNGVEGFGTCDFGNLTPYIRKETVFIPQPSWIPQNDSIADISYEQALAFYNWKFRIDKFVSEEESGSWQQYVFPTKTEFDQIKEGESLVLPEEEIEYSAPVFRLLVEVLPKN